MSSITTDKGIVHYEVYGRGHPVILLHGMSASADVYREVMHELADEFWLIAPDIPGFGRSENSDPYTLSHLVEWLASFQEKLNFSQIMLAGHSFGGALATYFTASYPQAVERLLLIAPAVYAGDLLPGLPGGLHVTGCSRDRLRD